MGTERADGVTGQAANRRRWPYLLWLLPLLAPAAVLGWLYYRLVHGPVPGVFLWCISFLSVAWIFFALGILFAKRGQCWIDEHRKQIALLEATVVIGVAIFDVGLNLSGRVPTIAQLQAKSVEYKPAVIMRHRMIPKTIVNDQGPPILINSRGYRGREIAVPKPAGVTRIVLLGGSQIFDFHGANWPDITEGLLLKAGKTVEVINAGVPGHASFDAVGKLIADLWLVQPDIVVLCNAWNDIKYFSDMTPASPYYDVVTPIKRDWRVYPEGLDRLLCYSALYRRERNWFATVVVGEEGEETRRLTGSAKPAGLRQYELNLETFCDVGRNLGIEVVLCKQARLPTEKSGEKDRDRIRYGYVGMQHDELVKALNQCDRIIDAVAARKQCRVVDMNGPLSGRSELFRDHIHFSIEGSREAARTMADALAPMIK